MHWGDSAEIFKALVLSALRPGATDGTKRTERLCALQGRLTVPRIAQWSFIKSTNCHTSMLGHTRQKKKSFPRGAIRTLKVDTSEGHSPNFCCHRRYRIVSQILPFGHGSSHAGMETTQAGKVVIRSEECDNDEISVLKREKLEANPGADGFYTRVCRAKRRAVFSSSQLSACLSGLEHVLGVAQQLWLIIHTQAPPLSPPSLSFIDPESTQGIVGFGEISIIAMKRRWAWGVSYWSHPLTALGIISAICIENLLIYLWMLCNRSFGLKPITPPIPPHLRHVEMHSYKKREKTSNAVLFQH